MTHHFFYYKKLYFNALNSAVAYMSTIGKIFVKGIVKLGTKFVTVRLAKV